MATKRGAKQQHKTLKHQTVEPKAVEPPSGPDEPLSLCPVIGIGASAGGLAAFEAFFSGMPADTDPGMAFVLVQHLAPDHKSMLSELIRRYTRMEVFQVVDGMVVKPNCAYIIPPNQDMAFAGGALQLLEPAAPRGQRHPIDFFFRSLAQDQHERAICIVLSGTGSDGTEGLRAIKGEGGMAMAQEPASTEYDGMPRNAIATGLVDYVLPAAGMPAQLIAYVARAFGKMAHSSALPVAKAEGGLKKIFVLLRAQTGHDFSQYKRSTFVRRVERRMAVHQIELLEEYARYLRQNPADVDALFHDLLIGVTNFFRDPQAFKALEEQAIPLLFAGKPSDASIRVWVPGCSTGEEAYSLAILLQECIDELKQNFKLHVFATDIDRRAIDAARAGIYPASIAGDISPERLARFFSPEPDGSSYRIKKSIRERIIFSEQDVIKDPPFSKLDLISCRNLLIYMGAELHKKVIPLFHYALNPGGILFLGSSETVGDFVDLFATIDRRSKIYQSKEVAGDAQFPPFVRLAPEGVPASRLSGKAPGDGKIPGRELTERALLQQCAASALVNERGQIFYLHGRTGKYLEPAPGDADMNILKMAREGLRRDLTDALHKTAILKEAVRYPGLRVKTNGDFTIVNLTVTPIPAGLDSEVTAQLFLVNFEDAPATGPKITPGADGDVNGDAGHGAGRKAGESAADVDANIATLKQELRAKEEYLQTTNEELKSSNEEMQSVNEELQSTNEELETSKEELQSVNEELATVNAELQNKVADLSRSNNDMNNLLAGTGIGTIFVDHHLRIQRFTPAVTQVINLIVSDVGRPVGHIVSNLVGYDHLVADVRAVLDSLEPRDVEVQTKAGPWFLMRIRPYRTLENVIEGAVITFTDITEMKHARAALRETEGLRRLAVVVRDAHDAITVRDLEGRILAWNPGAERMYGWSEAEALAMNIRDIIPEGRREEALILLRKQMEADVIEPYRMQRIAKDGRIVEIWITATALVNDEGVVYATATTERKVRSES